MLERRVTLFKLFGFSVRLHASWLLLGLLITWSLAEGWFPTQAPDISAAQRWWLGALGAVLLLFQRAGRDLALSALALVVLVALSWFRWMQLRPELV